MTLYCYLNAFLLTCYPIKVTADVTVDENKTLTIEIPVSPILPPYKSTLEYPANIVDEYSPLANMGVYCVTPYIDREKENEPGISVTIQIKKKEAEKICDKIDSGTLLGRYWNA